MTQDTTDSGTESGAVLTFTISQATVAQFDGIYNGMTFLCFVRTGSKRVICPQQGELLAREGDLLVFPPESFVTLENRPLPDASYRAEGAYYSHDLVAEAYPDAQAPPHRDRVHLLRADQHDSRAMLAGIAATLAQTGLPPAVRRHRLLEPLIWLRHHGVTLAPRADLPPAIRLRKLLDSDLARPWRSAEAAQHFAMSEPTFRRWLARSGKGFARVLHDARLERGLALLQTTTLPIVQIALDCGFASPSHFSESFRKRFGIAPKAIRAARD